MTAVTKRYGPSPDAFVLILPLASALFVSLVNVAAITLFYLYDRDGRVGAAT
jgi:sodium--glutamate symport carrier gltS